MPPRDNHPEDWAARELGKFIEEARKRKNVPLHKLAGLSQVPSGRLVDLLLGEALITKAEVMALARVLEVEPETLMAIATGEMQ